jgi:uncharacterized protein YuzE
VNITHDKESGALYIRLRDGSYSHTEDFSEGADVYLDVDADGTVLGLEALSFEDLAQAIEERGGRLEVPDRLRGIAAGDPGFDPEPLLEALSSLDPLEQELLRLRFMEGLLITEVAERLEISHAEASRLRTRALLNLRRALHGSTDAPEYEGSIEDALLMLRP